MTSFSNSGKLFRALPYTYSLSIYLIALPSISATAYWHATSVSATSVATYVIPTAIKQCIKVDNYACICVVLPLNGPRSDSFMLIYRWFLLANGAHIYIIADITYMGIGKKNVYNPAC